LRHARSEFLAPKGGLLTGEALRVRRGHIQRMEQVWRDAAGETRAQEVNVSDAAERLAAARESLSLRSRDVEGLEKHRARLERRFQENAARREAVDQEEMATLVYLRERAAR